MGTGRDMWIYVYGWVDGWMGKFFLGFVLLRFGSWGCNGRNEWRNLIFISRTYLINGIFICVYVCFFFSFSFSFFGHL